MRKEIAIERALDMSGSLHLILSYLYSWFQKDEWQGTMPKSCAKMKTLEAGPNFWCLWHVQSWCNVMLVRKS
jgi:hypothetical protein